MPDEPGTPSPREAIAAVYAQVGAPDWARPNLDALADVLRDLAWLPPGEVTVTVPADAPPRLVRVLRRVEAETALRDRPVRVVGPA